jgi:hypothetical protein
MKITVDQLGSLRKSDRVLYGYVLPVAHGVDGNFVEIDESKLVPLQRKLLAAWAKENDIQEEPAQHEKYCACEECFGKHVAENNAKENERLALVAQQKAAEARIMEYVAQGLANTEANREIFMSAWKSHPKLSAIEIPTVQLVDAVIALVRDKLTWQKPTPPTPAPAPEPEPVLLSDGSVQKPLDETPKSSWSVAQLKDWSKRSDAQKLFRAQQYGGASRSNFFKPDSQVI